MKFAKMTLKQLTVPGGYACSCGKTHKCELKYLEISAGAIRKLPEMLDTLGSVSPFVLFDCSTYEAAGKTVLGILEESGIAYESWMIPGAHINPGEWEVGSALMHFNPACDLILVVGSGVLNDIGKVLSHATGVPNAVVGTAPSMDGFASDTAPITDNNFKVSMPARQPRVVLADTDVLAAAPAELKSAGYGDMIAKYIAMADWRIANLTIGEYICPQVADLTRDAVRRVVAMTDRVTENDAQTAGAILEALVMTGVAMKLCGSSRAAAGAEHIVSHFWEIQASQAGLPPVYHGQKVGVASLMITRMYYDLIRTADPARFGADETDWARVYAAYGSAFTDDIHRLNSPTVTAQTSPEILRENWDAICRAVREEMPEPAALRALLLRANVASTPRQIGIPPALALSALQYHPYMRRRMTLSRLTPMLHTETDYPAWAGLDKKGCETDENAFRRIAR